MYNFIIFLKDRFVIYFFFINRDVIIVSCINCGISFFVGFVVFSVLGFMVKIFNVKVGEVVILGEFL